ncbi:MAG: phosphate/phosphite/phosphonate ABC transporter substrate-binding protein [Nitrospirae bacterium]|nr:phosphate/phosphite/phosphonate ABC transporter substrate-binding protein [Nitrospirota bacterium]
MGTVIRIIFLISGMLGFWCMPSFSAASEKPLTLMILPLESPTTMYESFIPLTRHIEKAVGRRVRLVVAKSGEAAIKDLKGQKADMAYICSVFYVLAHDNYRYIPLAKAVENESSTDRGVIIVRNDSDIHTVRDLRGRTLALGSRYCASSNLLPRLMIREAGLKEEDLFTIDVMGHNRRAILSVMNGFHDAAGVTESFASEYLKMGLRYIALSEPAPNFVFAVKGSMNWKLKNKLRQILTSLSKDQEGRQILKSIGPAFNGFEIAGDEEYAPVRKLIKKVGINWKEE